MSRPGILSILGALACIAATPSTQTPPNLVFEVASVKPVNPDLPLRSFICGFPPGRFVGFGPAQWFIACAYDISQARAGQEILNGPRWLDSELFSIEARWGKEVAFTREIGAQMLRALLAERFGLAAHRETREVPIYALAVARRDGRLGRQLRQTSADCAAWIAGGRRSGPPPMIGDLPCSRQLVTASRLQTTAMAMPQLANWLSPRVERPVEDRTGLDGYFAIDLQWKPEQGRPDASLPDSLPTSVFTALQEQLGLRLESTRGPVSVLIIDSVQRPTPD
jgi:uncharacterized protein (TIGR03435 family)